MEMEDPHLAKVGLRSTTRRRRRRQACVWFTVAALLAIILVIIILVFTVFKAHSPVTTINSVSISDLEVSFRGLGGGGIPLSFHLILAVNASVRNPNRVGIKYSNSSALLDYKGENIGEAPIPAGEISARETMPLNLTLTIISDRFLSKSQDLLSDVISGTLPLTAHTSVTGKVTILRFIHIRVISHSTRTKAQRERWYVNRFVSHDDSKILPSRDSSLPIPQASRPQETRTDPQTHWSDS